MRALIGFISGAVLLGFVSPPASLADEAAERLERITERNGTSLPEPGPRLRKNVDFWVSIYSQYYTHEGVIHDSKYVDKVYEVLDLKKSGRSRSSRIHKAKAKWRAVLLAVHAKQKTPGKMTPEERRVFDLFADVNEPNRFLNAAHRKRLRLQVGQKDRFIEGLYSSGKYLPMMEAVFRQEGVPVELTRLPFVESSFNLKARSKVGASGIWQFMRSTGRLFLTINDALDERNDPIRATVAAARLLKQNHESLGSWPLAVSAYNHGRMGMMRAVRQVGSTDLERIIESYRSRTFGFASRNFYAELLAAIEVERNAEKYFGTYIRSKPMKYVEAELPHYVDFRDLCKFLGLDQEKLRELNPGLSSGVFKGRIYLPKGYKLRLPYEEATREELVQQRFLKGYKLIPAMFKHSAQRGAKYDTRSVLQKASR